MSESPAAVVILIALATWYAMIVVLGAYVAHQKGRSTTEGAVLAALFGPLGVLVACLLPTRTRRERGYSAEEIREAREAGRAQQFLKDL